MKRTMVAGAAVLALFLAGCQWPMYGYGPAHTGHNTTESKVGIDNVASLTEQWRFTGPSGNRMISTPAVVGGVAFVGSEDQKLYAFDAQGKGCMGTPVTCEPLWTAATDLYVFSSPAVVGGVVYVGSDDGFLYAFDAAGIQNCSGIPTICEPLWKANTGGIESSPTVTDGRVYVNGLGLQVFDAAGIQNCSGAPTICEPLWSAAGGGFSSPAVVDGVVYIGSTQLRAYDAEGVANCSGDPRRCEPLWIGTVSDWTSWGSPSVADGVVYLASDEGTLHAFDASGATGCTGDPLICEPLWTGPTGSDELNASVPSVANGRVYLVTQTGLQVFDAAGVENCSGAPLTCAPVWTAGSSGFGHGSVAIANGVAYAGNVDGNVAAVDADGVDGCSGTPKVCQPLWQASIPGGSGSAPTIANGMLYIGSNDNSLVAFGL